jgi:hypothetical protein
MDSYRSKKEYSHWFSYHLGHVHFERRKRQPEASVHRFPWNCCGHCGYAMQRIKYTSTNNQFGLPSKQTRDNQRKVEKQVGKSQHTL